MEEAEGEIQGGSDEPKKCPDCKEYYGAEAYGGKCSVCYKQPTSGFTKVGIIQSGVASDIEYKPGPIRRKILCRTGGCSFYANEDLEGLCENCYEEYYEVTK